MSENMIINKARKIRKLEAQIEKLQQEADSIKSEIKVFMGNQELLKVGEYTIRYTFVTSTKLDTAAIKARFTPGDLEGFMKTTTVRRFSIA
ncbi:MAG: hypothetical protein IJG40_16105 [Oscillospiraceae bacterium]|nr:hypothetical protein [Oscillospiraceae bacterium]